MPLTPEKEALLLKLNQDAMNAHADAKKHAERMGKAPPTAPVPLKPEQMEYPKWLHKDWGKKAEKPLRGYPEHSLEMASESELANTPEEAEKLKALGYTEEPPKTEAKKKG